MLTKLKGFTLIEIIVVMAILAILVTLAAPKFLGQTEKAHQTQLLNDAKVLDDAITRYYIDEGVWPKVGGETSVPLTIAELDEKLYTVGTGFSTEAVREVDADFYDINLSLLKPYMKGFKSDIKNYVLQNPIGSIYILDPETNSRLEGYVATNTAPVASFTMSPENGLMTNTAVTFTSTSTDAEGDTLTETWTGKQAMYTTEGEYTVTLKVTDVDGLESIASKTFTVINATGVKQVASGNGHTIVLMTDGTVKAFGGNYYGQLGTATNNGTATSNPTPTLIPGLTGVKQIAVGDSHTIALMDDGTVKAFGNNWCGQLGNTSNNLTNNANSTPMIISGLISVKSVVAGGHCTIVLLNDGTVKAFGQNYYGQLGSTANNSNDKANPTPILIPELSGAKEIVTGGYHTVALMNDGTVKAFGYNGYGQLGKTANSIANPTPTIISGLSSVKQLAVGNSHTVVLMTDGTVKAFGMNYYGQLGSLTNNSTFKANPTPTIIQGLIGVKEIAAGIDYTFALMTDNTTKSFGFNWYGQLGVSVNAETNNANSTPIIVSELAGVKQIFTGYYYATALMDNGTLKAFGMNNCGQLGFTANNTANPMPTTVSGLI